MRRVLLAGVLLLAACKCTCPAPPDMSRPADMSISRDMSSAPDLFTCTACDAVINPCPALHLYCNPATRCCDSTPH